MVLIAFIVVLYGIASLCEGMGDSLHRDPRGDVFLSGNADHHCGNGVSDLPLVPGPLYRIISAPVITEAGTGCSYRLQEGTFASCSFFVRRPRGRRRGAPGKLPASVHSGAPQFLAGTGTCMYSCVSTHVSAETDAEKNDVIMKEKKQNEYQYDGYEYRGAESG